MEDLTDQAFQRYLLDLSANGLVIVALVMAVDLARKFPQSGTGSATVRTHQPQ
jgi:hypothetical protein